GDGCAIDDRRRRALHGQARRDVQLARAVEDVTQRVDDPAEEAVAYRHLEDLAGAPDLVTCAQTARAPEQHDADLVFSHVAYQAQSAVSQDHALPRSNAWQSGGGGHAAGDPADRAYLLERQIVGKRAPRLVE